MPKRQSGRSSQKPPGQARDPAALVALNRLAQLGTLVLGVAHEISNPLTYVIGNLGDLERGLGGLRDALAGYRRLAEDPNRDPAELRDLEAKLAETGGLELLEELASDALDGSLRIRDVVRNALSFGQALEGADAPGEAVDVNEVLDDTLRLIGRDLGPVGLERDLRATRLVAGSRSRLGQVFLNLLTNARDACSAAGAAGARIRVRSRDDEGGLRVEVEDSGGGIPEATRPHIFEPFFTTKVAGRGTGLGLYISRTIANEHGGRLEFEPARGGGTVFSVWLPAAGGG